MEGPALKDLLSRVAGGKRFPSPVVARVLERWRRAVAMPPSDLVVVEGSEQRLRATRVTRNGSAVRVVAASRTIPVDLGSSERPAREQAALTDIVAELGARGRPAVAVLGGPDVIVRRLTMPRLRPADLTSALELECRKQVTYPLAEAVIRHETLEGAAAPPAELPVVVAIAPRRRVDQWRSLLTAAGLRPWSITIAAAGLRADLARRGALSPGEVVAYLDVGKDASQILVLKGEDIRFSRDLAFGASTLASSLRQIVVPGVGTLERSPEAAEALLRRHGIPLGPEEATFVDDVPLAAVSIMLRPALERLVRELWNSFDYCNEQFLGDAVSRVVLLGDGRRTPNLAAYLAGVLKMPVTVADTEGGSERAAAEPAIADGMADSGAAMASVGRGTLNFLAGTGVGSAVGWMADAVPAPAVAAAAVMLLLSIAAPTEIDVARSRARVAGLQAELNRYAAQRDAVAQFRNARAEEERLRGLLTRLTGSQVVWSTALRDLSHRVGPDVRLTALQVLEPSAVSTDAPAVPEARAVRLSGLLNTRTASPERVLADLLRSLAFSPVFDGIRLERCERVSPTLSAFTVTARLAEGSGS